MRRANRRGLAAVVAGAVVAACGGSVTTSVQQVSSRDLVEVAAPPVAVVEVGDAVYVFAASAVAVVRGGVVATRVRPPSERARWIGGAQLAAPDGDGRWVVGLDSAGRLWHVTAAGELDPAGDRLGVGEGGARAIAAAGGTFAVARATPKLVGTIPPVASDDAMTVAASIDGRHVGVLPAPAGARIAVARGLVAIADATGVAVLDLARGTEARLALAGATAIAFTGADSGSPRLVVATPSLVYRADAGGTLQRLAGLPSPIEAIAASGANLWIAAHGALFEAGRGRATIALAPRSALFGSPSGDVWIAGASLARVSLGDAALPDPAWTARVAPIFARTCAHCHLPGGDAGFDLSTAETWRADRAELRRRVVDTRTMPPAGTELSEADRAILAAYLAE